MKIAPKRPRRLSKWLCAVLTVSTLAAALPLFFPAAVCASDGALSDGLPEHLSVAGAYTIPALWDSRTDTWFDGYGHMKAGENADAEHTVVYCLDRGLKGAPAHAPQRNWSDLLRNNREIAAGLTAIAQAGYPYQTGGLHPRRAELCTQLAIWIYLAKKGFSPAGGSNQDFFDQITDPPAGTPHPGIGAPPVESGGRAWIDALVEAGMRAKRFKSGQIAAVPSGSWRKDQQGHLLLDVRLVGDFDYWTPDPSDDHPAGISYSKTNGAPGETVTVIAASPAVLKTAPPVTFKAYVNESPVNFGWFDSVTDSNGRHQAWLAVHKTFRFTAGSAALTLPAPTGRLVVRKSGDNRLPIEGVSFQLLSGNTPVKLKALAANRYAVDPAGTYTTIKTDTGGVTAIDGLSAGTYTLKETSTPAPYLLPSTPTTSITIKVGEQTEQLITNKRAMGQIVINKTDAETGKSLSGAEFKVRLDKLTFPTLYKDWSASVGKDVQTGIKTAANGEVKTKQLPPGNYTIFETKTHEGYYLPETVKGIPVTITAEGKAVAEKKVAVENTPQHGQIIIDKRGDILKGWQTETVDETFNRTVLTGVLELDLPVTVQIPLSEKPATGSETSKASESTTAASSTTAAAEKAEASKANESVKPEAAVAPEAAAASTDKPAAEPSAEEQPAPVSGSEAPVAEKAAQTVAEFLPPSPMAVMGIRLFGAATPPAKTQSVTVEYGVIAPDGTVLKHIKGGKQTIPDLPVGTYTIVETNVPQAHKNYPDGLKADVKAGKDQVARTYTVHTPVWQEGSLPGAVFQIIAAEDIHSASTELSGSQRKPVLLHKKGAILDTLTSTASGPVKSKELPLGKYQLVESGVPHGYLKIDPIGVELKPDKPSIKVTSVSKRVLNEKQRYQIKFVKSFETSKWFEHHKAAPAETRFGLYNAEPIIWHGITLPKDSLMGLAKLNDQLEGQFDADFDGKYYIRELHTNEAYNLAKDTAVEAKFIEDGKPVETAPVVEPIQNTLKRGGLSLIKVDVETDATLAGAEYCLIAIKGDQRIDLGIYKTDSDGKLTISDLEFGQYELVEITAPAGYVRDDRPTSFMVDGEQDLSFQMTNRKNRIVIKKTDAETDIALPGAEITIYDADGNVIFSRLTDTDGIVSITGLAAGSYIFRETKAPSGYTLNDKPHPFVINPDGTPDSTVYNLENHPTELIITKTDPGNQPLAGAAFQLKSSSGQLYRFHLQNGIYIADGSGTLDTITGDHQGRILIRYLPTGTVHIIETKAPTGFRIGRTQTVEITENAGGQTPAAATVINESLPPEKPSEKPPQKTDTSRPPLPRSGEHLPFPWPALLIAFALCTAAVFCRNRKAP